MPQDPDLAAFADYEEVPEERTDPNIVLVEAESFIEATRAYESTVPGLILLVTKGMADRLLTATLPNKGWENEGVPYDGMDPPENLRALLFRNGTYRVRKGPDNSRILEVHVSTPHQAPGTSSAFSIPGVEVRAVLAYREGKKGVSWCYRP
jgi:hypothetical protein